MPFSKGPLRFNPRPGIPACDSRPTEADDSSTSSLVLAIYSVELSSPYPCELKRYLIYAEIPKLFFEVGEATGASKDAPRFYKLRMGAAGFVDVVESVFKVPSSPRPKDGRMKQVGSLELANFDAEMEASTLRGYTSMLL